MNLFYFKYIVGNIDGEGELDFDCSSQESTDSENDGLDNQMMDIVAHASPATNPYQPEPFSMSRILQQCKKGVSMSNNGQSKRKKSRRERKKVLSLTILTNTHE